MESGCPSRQRHPGHHALPRNAAPSEQVLHELDVGTSTYVGQDTDVFETHQRSEDLVRVDKDGGASRMLAHTTTLEHLRLIQGDLRTRRLPAEIRRASIGSRQTPSDLMTLRGFHLGPLNWALGGGDGIRTHGLYIANVALCQLSYTPDEGTG